MEGYRLKYKSIISGTISTNKLKDLRRDKCEGAVVWLNIDEGSRYEDELEFSVGIVSADFGVVNFEESSQCGCGWVVVFETVSLSKRKGSL